MPLLTRFGIAWLLGIVLARWFGLPWPLVALAGLPALSALLLYRGRPQAHNAALLALAVAAGALRFIWSQPGIDPGHIAYYNDGAAPVTITGLVVDEPDVRDDHIKLRLQAESVRLGDADRPVAGLVLVRAPRYPARAYGDRLTVTGRLETPPVFEDFSYKDYLARFGIHAMLRQARIEVIDAGQGNPLWAGMLAFKARASQTINRILVEPYASLLNGILLGIETGIPQGLYEAFNLTGTSHIIVISGSNISLIAAIFLLLGQKALGKRYAPPLAIVGIVIYTLLVGADAAVSRAAVMGLVYVLAIWMNLLFLKQTP